MSTSNKVSAALRLSIAAALMVGITGLATNASAATYTLVGGTVTGTDGTAIGTGSQTVSGVSVGNSAQSSTGVSVGNGAKSGTFNPSGTSNAATDWIGTAIGAGATTDGGVSVGAKATSTDAGTALGYNASASHYGVAIGANAKDYATGGIAIGGGLSGVSWSRITYMDVSDLAGQTTDGTYAVAGRDSIALGYATNNQNSVNSYSLGSYTTTIGLNNIVLGNGPGPITSGNTTTYQSSVVSGTDNIVLGVTNNVQSGAYTTTGSASAGTFSISYANTDDVSSKNLVLGDSNTLYKGSVQNAIVGVSNEVGSKSYAVGIVGSDNVVGSQNTGDQSGRIVIVGSDNNVGNNNFNILDWGSYNTFEDGANSDIQKSLRVWGHYNHLYANTSNNVVIGDVNTYNTGATDNVTLGNYNTFAAAGTSTTAATGNFVYGNHNTLNDGVVNNLIIGDSNTLATNVKNTIAITNGNTNIGVSNSVYLGNNADVSAAEITTSAGTTAYSSATIGGTMFSFAGAGSDTNGAVSVGTVGGERRIQNVAAGLISTASTDAINGSQLYSVIKAYQAADTTMSSQITNIINKLNAGFTITVDGKQV